MPTDIQFLHKIVQNAVFRLNDLLFVHIGRLITLAFLKCSVKVLVINLKNHGLWKFRMRNILGAPEANRR